MTSEARSKNTLKFLPLSPVLLALGEAIQHVIWASKNPVQKPTCRETKVVFLKIVKITLIPDMCHSVSVLDFDP